MALSDAIRAYGHPQLTVVPVICFEWLQRPETVLDGHLSWTDYRPAERPTHVRIFHHQTKQIVWHPLEEDGERFSAVLEQRLSDTDHLAVPIVVSLGERGAPRPYSFSFLYATCIVREAKRAAETARGYIKKTDVQRLAATRKRRVWVLETEQAMNERQNERQFGVSERR